MNRVVTNTHAAYRTLGWIALSQAVLYTLFLLASLLSVPALAPGTRIPNPFGSDAVSRAFFLANPRAVEVADFFQLASACCLAGLAAAHASLHRVRQTFSAGTAFIQTGGTGAAVLLALTALFSWAVASPNAVDPGPALHTLQFLPFLLGGPGWAGFFALFLVGVATAWRATLSRWLVGVGYCLAAVSALATLVLVSLHAAPCLPLARFLGCLWLIAVSAVLLRSQPA